MKTFGLLKKLLRATTLELRTPMLRDITRNTAKTTACTYNPRPVIENDDAKQSAFTKVSADRPASFFTCPPERSEGGFSPTCLSKLQRRQTSQSKLQRRQKLSEGGIWRNGKLFSLWTPPLPFATYYQPIIILAWKLLYADWISLQLHLPLQIYFS